MLGLAGWRGLVMVVSPDVVLWWQDEIDNEQPGQRVAQPEAAHDDHDLLNTFWAFPRTDEQILTEFL